MERDPDSYKSQRQSQLRIHAKGLGADGETVVGSGVGVGAITADQRCSLEKGALQPRILGEEDRQSILQDCNKPNLNIAC